MEFYLYILKCNDESYYIGHTEDLEKRVSEHNMGLYKCYTFNRRLTSRLEVLAAERKIKKWTRQKKERLIMFGWSGFLK
ncbi:MAG: excinuclease ABC subunit C [candidate division TM6 bacterium GW2011_GWF2_36_131]|nr:MAG: excinuclease ABC subunit C [candidate division TM6 bacterium GW2011_GWF2_36_131]